MIIDMHVHIRRGRGSLEKFIEAMDEQGIGMVGAAAIVPSAPETGDSGNEIIYECMERYPDRIFGWCSLLPFEQDAPAQLEHYVRDLGFKGLKLHPPIQGFAPSDPRTFPTVRKAIELDIPILYHTGPVYIQAARIRYGDPAEFDELALTFPEAKIVLAHGNPLGAQPYVAGKHPNVYMDTSGIFTRTVRFMPGIGEDLLLRRTTGITSLADKTMLGSDAAPTFPERLKECLDAVATLRVPEDVKRKVLGENAAKLLGLKIPAAD